MARKREPDAKVAALAETGTLNPHPEAVRDEGFASSEFLDARRSANEHLDSAGIAMQVRLVLLGQQHFSRSRTHRTRKHRFDGLAPFFEHAATP